MGKNINIKHFQKAKPTKLRQKVDKNPENINRNFLSAIEKEAVSYSCEDNKSNEKKNYKKKEKQIRKNAQCIGSRLCYRENGVTKSLWCWYSE